MATATETKVTEKQSSIAIQNLLTITVSEVLYSRGLVPKDNFCRVKMAGNYLHKMDDPAEGDGSKVAVLSRKAPFDIFILVTTMLGFHGTVHTLASAGHDYSSRKI
jgi:hypothetical protein